MQELTAEQERRRVEFVEKKANGLLNDEPTNPKQSETQVQTPQKQESVQATLKRELEDQRAKMTDGDKEKESEDKRLKIASWKVP